MPRPLRALYDEHRDIAKLIKALERQHAVLRENGPVKFDVVAMALQYFANYPDLVHHPMEDLVYRRLVERDPSIASQVEDIVAEHEAMEARTRGFIALIDKQRTDDPAWTAAVADHLREFISAYWRHLTIEEESLFPRALTKLSSADWAEIEAAIDPRVDPLFGDGIDHQYRELRDEILRFGA